MKKKTATFNIEMLQFSSKNVRDAQGACRMHQSTLQCTRRFDRQPDPKIIGEKFFKLERN